MSLVMSHPHGSKVPASRHSQLPVARGRDGHELDELRAQREASHGSDSRMNAAVVCSESSDPYADPPCTD